MNKPLKKDDVFLDDIDYFTMIEQIKDLFERKPTTTDDDNTQIDIIDEVSSLVPQDHMGEREIAHAINGSTQDKRDLNSVLETTTMQTFMETIHVAYDPAQTVRDRKYISTPANTILPQSFVSALQQRYNR